MHSIFTLTNIMKEMEYVNMLASSRTEFALVFINSLRFLSIISRLMYLGDILWTAAAHSMKVNWDLAKSESMIPLTNNDMGVKRNATCDL